MQRQRRHRRRVSAGLYEERGCVSRCTCDCLVDDGCSRRSKATTMTMLSRGFRPVRAHFFPNNSEVTVPIPNTVRQLPSWLHVAGHAFCRRRCCDVPALRNAGVLFGRSTADVGHLHRSGNYADGWISLFLQRLARRPPRNVTWITVKRQTSILALHSTDAPRAYVDSCVVLVARVLMLQTPARARSRLEQAKPAPPSMIHAPSETYVDHIADCSTAHHACAVNYAPQSMSPDLLVASRGYVICR